MPTLVRLFPKWIRARLRNGLLAAGWTPLHYASLLSPPTLVSYLLTNGSSPLSVTRRGLTALDIVTAHSTVPGREDVALLLEEAMREAGWQGGRMEEQRRILEKRMRRLGKQRHVQEDIERILGINHRWWGDEDALYSLDTGEDSDDEAPSEATLVSPSRTASCRRLSMRAADSTARFLVDACVLADGPTTYIPIANY